MPGRELINSYPDNYKYHASLRAALGVPADSNADLSDEQRARLSDLYAELQQSYPRSSAAFRIPLDFKVGRGSAADPEVLAVVDCLLLRAHGFVYIRCPGHTAASASAL